MSQSTSPRSVKAQIIEQVRLAVISLLTKRKTEARVEYAPACLLEEAVFNHLPEGIDCVGHTDIESNGWDCDYFIYYKFKNGMILLANPSGYYGTLRLSVETTDAEYPFQFNDVNKKI